MDDLAKLYDLQQVLLQRAKLVKHLSVIQEDPKISTYKENILSLKSLLDDKIKQINSLEREQKKQEDQANTVLKQRIDYEEKMYSGRITNPKELEQIQRKIRQLQKEETHLEEIILQLMLNIDTSKEIEEDISRKLKKEESLLSEFDSEYKKNTDQIASEINRLDKRINETEPQIAKNLYERFQTICQKRAGLGIVAIKEGICGGCQVSLSAFILEKVWKGQEIVICESCGRILYGVKNDLLDS